MVENIKDMRFDKKEAMKSLQNCMKEGRVDNVMIPYINRINSLSDIHTGACCSSHRSHKYESYIDKGYIVLDLNAASFKKLYSGRKYSLSFKYRFDRDKSFNLTFMDNACLVFFTFCSVSKKNTCEIMEELCSCLERCLGEGDEQ